MVGLSRKDRMSRMPFLWLETAKESGHFCLRGRRGLTEENWYGYEQSFCPWLDKVPLWGPIDQGRSVHRECSSSGSLKKWLEVSVEKT